jgi:hypothetical protein
MSRVRSLFAVVSMLVVSQAASGSGCLGASPFDDVPADAEFCSNAEWLKNRGVTVGCTATLYCPTDPVTRAQMALFMNRLAIALVPSINVTSVNLPAIDLDDETVHCETPSYTITDFARTIVLTAHFSGLATGALAYSADLRYNTTEDPNVFPNAIGAVFHRTGTTGATWTHVSASGKVDLDVGTTYRFAIRIMRQGGTGELSDARCTLLQTLQPRERNSILP